MLQELIRPRQRPVTNVVAVVVIAVTFLPILAAYYLTREGEADRPAAENSSQGGHVMDTEMLIGAKLRDRHRDAGDGAQSEDRRNAARTARGLAPSRSTRRSTAAEKAFDDLVADDARRALRLLLKLADRIEAEAEEFAALEALNCGKPHHARAATTRSRRSSTASASSPARCARMPGMVGAANTWPATPR